MNRITLSMLMAILSFAMNAQPARMTTAGYLNNREPLSENPYIELPLGSIKATGWLRDMLLRQKEGATGHLDEMYPQVMGNRNGWLGGDGDQWERGPYWIDGLLPLACILNDQDLQDKAKPWIEWALNSQREDGYFGPAKDYPPEQGLQRDNCGDWWPKMVMLKILKQYYSATSDPRVIPFMTRYFNYQLKSLTDFPLDHWTFWAKYRAGDNLQVVYWLYNLTGDRFLLDLADLLHAQTYDFTDMFLNSDVIATQGDMHCVNLAQGIKEPVIRYQQDNNMEHINALNKGLSDIRKYMGQPQGMYGGDENIRNANPVNGSELCSAVELMFSLESMLPVTGNTAYADHLERIAYNALPAQINDDFTARQYFQQPNQVMITRHVRNFSVDHQGTDVCFGLLTGYPCCTSNMHQGWPKFTQNLWYATPDGGLASLVYAPSSVTVKVADGAGIQVEEITNYPFTDKITFVFHTGETAVTFPFHLRIPAWCAQPLIRVNGQDINPKASHSIIIVEREWNNGDSLIMTLPMKVTLSRWYENSVAVERGPLVYALRIREKWDTIQNTRDPQRFGNSYFEVHPESDWNYALIEETENKIQEAYRVVKRDVLEGFLWNIDNAPVEIKVMARKIRNWTLYNESAGPIPYSTQYGADAATADEEITLIPYGCTTLRISEFPLVIR